MINAPSNTPMAQLTSLTTPNGIQIQSAVLPQYTCWTDRQNDRLTNRWDWQQLCKSTHLVLTLYYTIAMRPIIVNSVECIQDRNSIECISQVTNIMSQSAVMICGLE